MSRGRLAVTMAAASLAAGALGYAAGTLYAPAAGYQTRRRLAWRARRSYRSMGRTCEQIGDRLEESAAPEVREAIGRIVQAAGRYCAR